MQFFTKNTKSILNVGNVFKCNGCLMSSHGRKLLIGLCLLVGQIQLNPRRRPRAQADGPGKLKS